MCETNKRWSEDRHELEKAAKAPGVEENEKLLGTEGDGCGVQPVIWGLRTRKAETGVQPGLHREMIALKKKKSLN